jgi:hypothetical protein
LPTPLLPALLDWLLGDVCLPPLRFSADGTAAIEPDAVVSLTGGARLLKFLRPSQFHAAPVEIQVSFSVFYNLLQLHDSYRTMRIHVWALIAIFSIMMILK